MSVCPMVFSNALSHHDYNGTETATHYPALIERVAINMGVQGVQSSNITPMRMSC